MAAWLVAGWLVKVQGVVNEVKVQAEDPVLLAVLVAAELLRKLPQVPMKHPADFVAPSRCPWQSIHSNGRLRSTTYNCCYCALCTVQSS